ncbi:gastric triacylglycerol lipase-like [Culicoides brevitarsis]|uniref:gastric triacylglycerol lipase-like n=1 Tax=Culicoides brevitarsis TaxID=469753 RepID=UPI00307BCC7E
MASKYVGDNMGVRTLEHYNQFFRFQRFARFDYGERENLIKYKQKCPPKYDVTTIDIPISIASLTSDIVATPKDCRSLKKKVKNSRIRFFVGNHWDLWASPATTNKIVDDYEEFIDSEDFIIAAGYPVETHHITTQDGYILTLHRIPSTNFSSSPVLLVHPMTTSGIIWVLPLTRKAKPIAFGLSDLQHDVWILHFRGTKESLRHRFLKASNIDFWNYTAHELAIFDIRNSVDYILEKTKKEKINYLGISQGSSSLMMLLATKPEYNGKISAAYLVSPIFESNFIPFSVQMIYGSDFSDLLIFMSDTERKNFADFGNRNMLERMKFVAGSDFLIDLMLKGASLVVGNFNPNVNYSSIFKNFNVIGDKVGLGTVKHYSQILRHHRFARFDYGEDENRRVYDQNWPPTYDVTKIKVPTTIVSLKSDIIANPEDCQALKMQIKKSRIVDFEGNHVDFWSLPQTINGITGDFEEFVSKNR